MAVRTTPLQQTFAITSTPQLCMAGLPDKTKLIKELITVSTISTARTVYYKLNGTSGGQRLLIVEVPGHTSVRTSPCFIVLGPDDELYVEASGAGCLFSAFGALLDGAVV